MQEASERAPTATPDSGTKVTELNWLALEFVLFHLSEADRGDTFGQSPTENPLEIAGAIMHANKHLGWAYWRAGRPAAVAGVWEIHRGVWALYRFGTDQPDAALALLAPLLEEGFSHIKSHGGRRLECKSRLDRRHMMGLLRLLGFRIEGRLRGFAPTAAIMCNTAICSKKASRRMTRPRSLRRRSKMEANHESIRCAGFCR
jgi:hypothetical protein